MPFYISTNPTDTGELRIQTIRATRLDALERARRIRENISELSRQMKEQEKEWERRREERRARREALEKELREADRLLESTRSNSPFVPFRAASMFIFIELFNM